MSVSDFLFGGQAPASTTTYGSTTSQMPAWYNDFVQGVVAKGNAIAAEPFQAYGQPRIADFNSQQTSTFDKINANAGKYAPTLQSGLSGLQQAAGQTGATAAQPFLGQAAGMSATGAAQPYANQAGQTFTGANVGQYMNPFIDNVVNRTGTMAARQLSEKLMPAINQDFIRAGQYGSTRMMGEVGKALRDVNDSMTEQIGTLYSQGYNQAGQMFGQDMGRQAQLAGTMGNLTNTEQGNIANIGQVAGNLSQAGINSQIQAGKAIGDMASLGQTMDLKDTTAQLSVGDAQRALEQSNLDMAYKDFQEQRDYPKSQLGWMSDLVRGYQQSIPSSSTTTNTAQPGASASNNLSTITGGLASVLGAFKAKGGRINANQIRRNAPVRGGLHAMRRAHG